MKILYENASTDLGQRVVAAAERGLAVANASRPLRGDDGRWEQWLPRQHGCHYAIGSLAVHERSWTEDDAWLVVAVTNEEIVQMLREKHFAHVARHAHSSNPKESFNEYLARYEEIGMDGIAHMAKQQNLPYIAQ